MDLEIEIRQKSNLRIQLIRDLNNAMADQEDTEELEREIDDLERDIAELEEELE